MFLFIRGLLSLAAVLAGFFLFSLHSEYGIFASVPGTVIGASAVIYLHNLYQTRKNKNSNI